MQVVVNRYAAIDITPALKDILASLSLNPFQALSQIRVIQKALNGLGALARIPKIGAYHDSVVVGENNLRQLINQEVSACSSHGTKLILVGYSQGAQVTGDVFQSLNARQRTYVAGIVLFGDPRYNHLSFAGTAKRDNNGILPVRGEFPAGSPSKLLSFCHAQDPICQGLGQYALHLAGAHKTYDQLGEPKKAADILLKAAPQTSRPKPGPKPASKWPTNRHDGPSALYIWMGANLTDPSWTSCDSDYCLAGSESSGLVYVFSMADGINQIGWVNLSIADPAVGLSAVGVPQADIAQLMAP